MQDAETEFLKAIGMTKRQFGRIPDFMVKTGEGRVRVLLRSKLEPAITFGEWTVITLTPEDFVKMAHAFPNILSDVQKRTKQKRSQ